MLVLGLDPGMATTGYGLIEVAGPKIKAVDYGCIKTSPPVEEPRRLSQLFQQVEELITNYRPSVLAVEELFFNKNVRSALTVGQARGVALLAAAQYDLNVVEYTPLQVKQGVVGYGRASKKQVQEMVKILLDLEEIPQPDDAADALAVAICYVHSLPLARCLERIRR